MDEGIRILHLEDNGFDADLVRHALERAGLHCAHRVVTGGREFAEALETGGFDVILSDHGVPGIGSPEALALSRKHLPGVPFIVVSGFPAREREERMRANPGAADCISKDDLRLLAPAIRQATHRRPGGIAADLDYVQSMERLVRVVQELSLARSLETIMEIVRHAARDLTNADGATFVLREGDLCHYAEEDAIAPLWKGKRFPMSICISGWAMLNKQAAVIEDIYADDRIPADAYRPTFVKSLVMVPIRSSDPVGAIGNYWATKRRPTAEQVKLLQSLADCTSVAMENVMLYSSLEAKVSDRTARLEAVNKELEGFSYSISHDLRAPLRHIGSYAELLDADAQNRLSDDSKRHLGAIRQSVNRMGTLIEDLLQFSRTGKAELRRRRVSMNAMVGRVRRQLEGENIGRTLNWQVEALPEVDADPSLLEQVWVNLLSNAVKYSRNASPAEITIGARTLTGEIEFFVRDNGAGFDSQYAQKLFGVFQRLHHASEFEGNGIGLANVQRIIARHGGRVRAEGQVGKGATFYFTLPVASQEV